MNAERGTEMQVYSPTEITPADARQALQAIREFQAVVQAEMVEGHDYGVIPGTQKPTLLKPGAEKLAKLLKCNDSYEILEQTEDWDKPFFYYMIKCRLVFIQNGILLSEGLGSANSYEAKWRYRWAFPDDVPAHLDKSTLRVKKFTSRKGDKITQYRVENEDVYSLVNTILKMAKKRALVDAALSAGRLSDLFTQDMDESPQPEAPPGASQPASDGARHPKVRDSVRPERPGEPNGSRTNGLRPQHHQRLQEVAVNMGYQSYHEEDFLEKLSRVIGRILGKITDLTPEEADTAIAKLTEQSKASSQNGEQAAAQVEPEQGENGEQKDAADEAPAQEMESPITEEQKESIKELAGGLFGTHGSQKFLDWRTGVIGKRKALSKLTKQEADTVIAALNAKFDEEAEKPPSSPLF